jgi:hypothetical protein
MPAFALIFSTNGMRTKTERVEQMGLVLPSDEEFGGDEQEMGRGSALPPERFHRSKPTRRIKMRARRSRSNDMAKRGMHQRRNKRLSW